MARDKKYGIYLIPNENREFEEEPIFIIRGKDVASVKAIEAYGHIAYQAGASRDLLADCINRSLEFKKWQERNKEIIKVPD